MKTYISQPPPCIVTEDNIRAAYEQGRVVLSSLAVFVGFVFLLMFTLKLYTNKVRGIELLKEISLYAGVLALIIAGVVIHVMYICNYFNYDAFKAIYITNGYFVEMHK